LIVALIRVKAPLANKLIADALEDRFVGENDIVRCPREVEPTRRRTWAKGPKELLSQLANVRLVIQATKSPFDIRPDILMLQSTTAHLGAIGRGRRVKRYHSSAL